MENFANNFTTLLTQAIGRVDTTIKVASELGSPDPNFRILIDAEYMLVTAKSVNGWQVTRGIEGSVAQIHASTSEVNHVLTIGSLNELVKSAAVKVGDYVAAENILKGQPLYVSKATGQIGLADVNSYVKSLVLGYAVSDCLAGFSVAVMKGQLDLADWNNIAGTTQLLVGQIYFLSDSGKISSTPPIGPIKKTSTVIGMALTPTVLEVKPSVPILL